MPYTHSTFTDEKARDFAVQPAPMGLGLTAEQASGVAKVVWIASSFTDPGDDWNRFDCYDSTGKLIARRHFNGY